jgi:YVTN family beta-propeller protein
MRTHGLRHGSLYARWPLRFALWLSIALAASVASPRLARADGGAPNLAYVAGGGAIRGDLVIIDIGQRRVTGRIPLGSDPAGVVLSADGRDAYVTEAGADRVAIVDTHGQRVTATMPAGPRPGPLALALSGSTPLLYVADSGGSTVTVLDPEGRRVVATILVGQRPMGIAVAGPSSGIRNPDDAEVYVANAESDTVSVISVARRQVVATIAAPGGPLGVVIPATGGIAYVSTHAGAVLALSLADRRLLGTVLRAPQGTLGAMDYDGVTGQIYVPDAANGVVDVLAPVAATNGGATPSFPAEPARTLPIGGGPAAVAITFDGAYGFVAEQRAGRVAMLDAPSHRVLATVAVGGAPSAIITGPYPPSVSSQTAFLIDIIVIAAILAMMVWGLIAGARGRPRKAGDQAGIL